MGKIRIHGKNKIYTVKNFTKYPEEVNELLLQSINRGDIPGILQVEYEPFGRKAELTISIRNCEQLSLYLAPPTSVENFLDVMLQISGILKELDALQYNLGNLDLQMDRIFVNPVSREVFCIYWPTVNNTEERAPQEFLRRAPVSMQFRSYSAKQYIDPYMAFFANGQPFSIRNFDRFIHDLTGALSAPESPPAREIPPVTPPPVTPPPVVPPVKPPTPERPPMPAPPPAPGYYVSGGTYQTGDETGTVPISNGPQYDSGSGAIEYIPPSVDSGSSYAGGMGQRIFPDRRNAWGATVDDTAKIGTGYTDQPGRVRTAFLTLAGTGESRVIYSDIFRIGTDRVCEFRVANRYVSRLHAEIRKRGNRYFLADLMSMNGTYIDGGMIPKGGEVEIFSGTHFVCASEEFIFSVEAR